MAYQAYEQYKINTMIFTGKYLESNFKHLSQSAIASCARFKCFAVIPRLYHILELSGSWCNTRVNNWCACAYLAARYSSSASFLIALVYLVLVSIAHTFWYHFDLFDQKKMLRIGIVGSGIVGLATSVMLKHVVKELAKKQIACSVTLMERVVDPKPVGAGFLIQPTVRLWKICNICCTRACWR